jgi:hypothetical protein
MDPRIKNDSDQLDHRTCVSICDAIGERLQRNLRPEAELSPRLRELVDELQRAELRAADS